MATASGGRQSRTKRVRVACNPHTRRQLDERGLIILWRDATASGRREGLACTLDACANSECPCRDVHLQGFLVDDRVVEISWNERRLRVRRHADPEATSVAASQGGPLHALVDVETGEVRPHDEDNEGPLLDWIRSEVDGELLEHLHRTWMRIRGYRMGLPRSRINLGEHEPGGQVAFEELFADERADMYLLDGHRYFADTCFCIEPDCTCDEARVVFYRMNDESAAAVGSVRVRVPTAAGGAAWVVERDDRHGASRDLLRALWERFEGRHDIGRYLGRRRERVHALVPELAKLRTKPAPARAQGSQPGRNDPCPCGSGRKFKKCCLGKESAP